MNKSKKENWTIALIVIGMVAMIACAFVARIMDMKIISIVGYVVGGIIILTGIVLYFVNYYKPEKYDKVNTKEISSQNVSPDTGKYYNNDTNTSSYMGTSSEVVFEDEDEVTNEIHTVENVQKPADDFYAEDLGENNANEDNPFAYMANMDIKQNYKNSTFSEKFFGFLLLFFTVGSIAILLIDFFFVKDRTLYMILMIYGMTTFAGSIIIGIFTSIIQRQSFLRYLKSDKSTLFAECDIAEGKVLNCRLYSHAQNSIKKGPYSNKNINKVVVEVTNSNHSIGVVRMLTLNNYKVGSKVKFYQKRENPKKCYIIEDNDIL